MGLSQCGGFTYCIDLVELNKITYVLRQWSRPAFCKSKSNFPISAIKPYFPQGRTNSTFWAGLQLRQDGLKVQEVEEGCLPVFLWAVRRQSGNHGSDNDFLCGLLEALSCFHLILLKPKMEFKIITSLTPPPPHTHTELWALMFISEALNSIIHPGSDYGHGDPRMSFIQSSVKRMAFILIINLGLEQSMWLRNLQNKLFFIDLSYFTVLFVYVEVMCSLFKWVIGLEEQKYLMVTYSSKTITLFILTSMITRIASYS